MCSCEQCRALDRAIDTGATEAKQKATREFLEHRRKKDMQ